MSTPLPLPSQHSNTLLGGKKVGLLRLMLTDQAYDDKFSRAALCGVLRLCCEPLFLVSPGLFAYLFVQALFLPCMFLGSGLVPWFY